MRKALNENPMVQLGVLAVGGLLLAFIAFSSFGGGGSEPPPPAAGTDTATPPAASTSAAAPAASATPSTAAAPAAAAAPATPAATAPPATSTAAAGSSSADGLLPGAGLPKDVLIAYAKNKAIALLVIDPKAISDKTVESYTKALQGRDDVEVFIVKARDIADYARITQGVSVTRTPALVVIRPRGKSDGAPTASVSEGFRGTKSVKTALEDALYTGGNVPSYPE